jgi:hypothetical protein
MSTLALHGLIVLVLAVLCVLAAFREERRYYAINGTVTFVRRNVSLAYLLLALALVVIWSHDVLIFGEAVRTGLGLPL